MLFALKHYANRKRRIPNEESSASYILLLLLLKLWTVGSAGSAALAFLFHKITVLPQAFVKSTAVSIPSIQTVAFVSL